MHVVLAALGTDGDVLPYMGVGVAMRRRGHRVTLAASGQYEPLAKRHDLEFAALMTVSETEELIGSPDFWHPLKGPWVATRFAGPLMERQYKLLAELAADKDAMIAASPGVVVARVVQEKLGRPMTSVLLQPWFIKSSILPPVMPGGLTLPAGLPRIFGAIYWRMIDAMGDFMVGRALNRLRKSLGIVPQWGVQSWLYPGVVIGMFPDWYGPTQMDWPPELKLTGFARFDGTMGAELDRELFEFCRAGGPPAVFSFGTGFRHGGEMFEAAVEACRMAGMRGIFLTKFPEQLPSALPEFIVTRRFAPFRALFPHCGVVVHHGGIGTVAEAFAAGIPQLILPVGWDQDDNATRVKRLGVGDWLKRGKRSAAKIAGALVGLNDAAVKGRCKAIAAKFEEESPLEASASAIEEVARAQVVGQYGIK